MAAIDALTWLLQIGVILTVLVSVARLLQSDIRNGQSDGISMLCWAAGSLGLLALARFILDLELDPAAPLGLIAVTAILAGLIVAVMFRLQRRATDRTKDWHAHDR